MNASKQRKFPWLILIAAVPGVVLTFAAGLWVYVSATATPLHPDAQKAPSVMLGSALPQWADAVHQGQKIARDALTAQNVPGLSVAVGVGGRIVWAESFGFANLEDRTTLNPEMRLRVGEASKALTSAAVGLLLEKDRFKLDDEIHAYVPDFPKKPSPITLRQLMAETAGITTDAGDEAWMNPCKQTLEGLQLFAKDPLLFEPGTRYSASSYGWILVSAAIEAAADEPFFAFMRRQIFEPLAMNETVPDTSATDSIPDLATFYFPRFGGDTRYGPESVREGDHSCYGGASAFLATPSDLVRFGIAMSAGGTLLRPATIRLFETPQRLTSGQDTNYGLGWQLDNVTLGGQPARMAGHAAKEDFIGGSTYLMTFPDRGIVVAAMSNISFADMKAVALSLAQAFAERQ